MSSWFIYKEYTKMRGQQYLKFYCYFYKPVSCICDGKAMCSLRGMDWIWKHYLWSHHIHPNICTNIRYDHLRTWGNSPTFIYNSQYAGCNRRNGPDFGRVFLRSNYTDITQNTYIQNWTVSEIMASEILNFDSCYTLTNYQIHIETGRNMWFL